MDSMRAPISRRRFLKSTAAGLSTIAMPDMARAQLATQAPPKQITADEFSVTAPVSIEVNARPLPSFDTRNHQHVRFGALEYRSGLILTSRFRGFGGLSGLRLDAKGGSFISLSPKGTWGRGRTGYRGRGRTARARRSLCLHRPRPRQPRASFRFQQGLHALARRGGAAAGGGAQAALQQGAGSAGDGAQGPAARGDAYRDLRARPRSRQQPDRVSDRGSFARPVQRSPHR